MKIKVLEEKQDFKPVSVEVVLESQQDANDFYHYIICRNINEFCNNKDGVKKVHALFLKHINNSEIKYNYV